MLEKKSIMIVALILMVIIGFFALTDYYNKIYPKLKNNEITEEPEKLDFQLNPVPVKKTETNFDLQAKSAKVVDLKSNEVILEKSPETKLQVASLTKLMTALVVMENAKRTDVVIVPAITTSPGEAVMGLTAGEKIKVEELMKGLLIHSAGDAAETLAVRIAGTEAKFVEMMNKKASDLGLKNTHFANPVGLDSNNNYSTAEDLTNLTRVLLNNKDFREIIKTTNYTAKNEAGRTYGLATTNKILDNITFFGVKTGFTFEAGECLITLAKKENHEILIVLIGSPDRFGETRNLTNWVYNNYQW